MYAFLPNHTAPQGKFEGDIQVSRCGCSAGFCGPANQWDELLKKINSF